MKKIKKEIKKINKNKNKNEYFNFIKKNIKEYKTCRVCGGAIYYYDSIISVNRINQITFNGKSFLSSKTINDKVYYLSVCEDCLSKEFDTYNKLNKSRIFNRMCNITSYAFDIDETESKKWKQNNYSITIESMINKYGDTIGKQKWESYVNKQSYSNSFEYKKNKYDWTRDDFNKFNKTRSITLSNMIEKHGEEDGIKLWDSYVDKQKIIKSKNYTVNKYGEKYWVDLCEKKSHSLKSVIKRCGKVEGLKLYINNFNKMVVYPPSKKSQDFFKNIDLIISKKYTTYYSDKNEEYCFFDNDIGFVYFDYFIKEKNIIIEFNGDIWHANPNKFNGDDIVPILNKKASDIWEKDKKRYDILKQKHNFNIIVIWETDKIKISDLIKKINEVK